MTRSEAFWDSSALIPLCISQPTTPSVHRLAVQYSSVVWWGTPIEIYSGIARLHRFAEIDIAGRQQAWDALAFLQGSWQEILPSEPVRDMASRVLDQHPLRAADAIQLAAALIWCDNRPTNRTFITADIRLSEAAARSGFSVVSP